MRRIFLILFILGGIAAFYSSDENDSSKGLTLEAYKVELAQRQRIAARKKELGERLIKSEPGSAEYMRISEQLQRL